MPFMAYTEADKGVTISKRFVMFVVTPVEDLVNQIRQMDSGIVVPEKKVIG